MWVNSYRESGLVASIVLYQDSKPVIPHLCFPVKTATRYSYSETDQYESVNLTTLAGRISTVRPR